MEPIAVIFAPCGINILYTLGWLVEVPARLTIRNLSPSFGPLLMATGFALAFVQVQFTYRDTFETYGRPLDESNTFSGRVS